MAFASEYFLGKISRRLTAWSREVSKLRGRLFKTIDRFETWQAPQKQMAILFHHTYVYI